MLYQASVTINFDNRDVCTKWVGGARRLEGRLLDESRFTSRGCNVSPRTRDCRRTGDMEFARLGVEHHVGSIGLKKASRNLTTLLDDSLSRLVDSEATLLQRA